MTFILFSILSSILFLSCNCQKLVVIVADGISGSKFHRFAHLPGFSVFEEEGVWSTKVHGVFPTLPAPNRHSIMTGLIPRRHGIIGDFMYNRRTEETFANFTQQSDFDQSTWWTVDPIYVTSQYSKAATALFFFPECNIDWSPSPSVCIPPRGISFADDEAAKKIVEATRTHDLVMVYHPNIRVEMEKIGASRATNKNSIEMHRLQESLERLTSEARERIDLNIMVVSPHGMTDVPRKNIRFLEDYIDMELLRTTVGSGALKQLVPHNGKTHQVFTQLRHHNPIPNVKIYYTASKVGDLPTWYHYKRSATVADLVLIAQPGYAIVTGNSSLHFPDSEEVPNAISGYNNHFPDMLGTFLAYGPLFKKGYRKGPLHLTDLYHLMCRILGLQCRNTPQRLVRIDDILSSDARVAMRAAAFSSNNIFVIIFMLLILCIKN